MKKILITGTTGFVGKHLVEHLTSLGQATLLGPTRGELNLFDADAVAAYVEKHKPDIIYHLAALTSPGESFKNPGETITNNILAELHILEALKRHDMKETRMLVISTSEVYGIVAPEDLPVDETTPHRPASPYAVSKIAQDYLGLQYHLAHQLDVVRVRPFNHIGPGQSDRFALPSFAKQIAEIEKGKHEPVLRVGNLDAKRDFTDVRDMVKAYTLAVEKGTAGEAYNIGSGASHRVGDMLDMFLSFSKTKITVEKDPARFRPLDFPDITCDYGKFARLTGWKPTIPLKKTLEDILEYFRSIV